MRFGMGFILASLMMMNTVVAETKDPPKAAAPALPTQPATASGPKAAAFAKVFEDWTTLLSQLHQLRQEYGSAAPERKKEIEKQFDDLLAKGTTMQPEVAKAAEEAYAENSGEDKKVEEFLVATCAGNIKLDNFEESLRLAELLLSRPCSEKNVYAWAGISAYCVGELDKAQKYLAAAREKGVNITSGTDYLDAMVGRFMQSPGEHKKAWEKEQAIRAAEAKADNLPRVLLKTNKGDIVIELFENEAPLATANFISLVEQGFYNGLGFHRVLRGFMAQGGCPRGDGTGGPGYRIPCECQQPNFRKHFRGTLSMAHAGRDTGGSQFFLTFVPTTSLDGAHTAFGRVIDGMDVLSKIQRRDPDDRKATLPPPDKIIEAKVLRKQPHEYVPKKLAEKN